MLTYPKDLRTGEGRDDADYVRFYHREWKPNRSPGKGKNLFDYTDNSGKKAPYEHEGIILYMPNSTPQAGYSQDWNAKTFAGPLNGLKRSIAQAAGGAIDSALDQSTIDAFTDGGFEGGVDSLKNKFKGAGSSFGGVVAQGLDSSPGIAKQLAMEAVGKALVGSGSNLLALSSGKVYNPNVELLYQSPILRNFTFNFDFVPKNSDESQIVDKIIKEFKKWSAPRDDGGFLCVPHVWDISYGGIGGKKMNKFKPCAMTNITVQDNAGSNFHTTFEDGTPVLTSIRMSFQEVDILLHKDHDKGDRGF